MAANIIDYIAGFVILLSLMTITVTTMTQTLDNIYDYHNSQQMNTLATNVLNDLTESTGSPPDWATSSVNPTGIGLRWAIGGSSYINPFAPIRLMNSTVYQGYGPNLYDDLSSTLLSPWPGVNLYMKTSDGVTYNTASKLLNTNGTYGWRVTYTPAYNIEVATTTPNVIPWYTGWGYRMAITIDHTKLPSTINNYPLLISITQPSLTLNAFPDGSDILFTTSDKLTKIPHEIDSYNSVTGQLNAWVKVPQLSSTVDTILYIYYGNPTATNQQSPSQVWAGYNLVTHMEDNPDSSHVSDSSQSLTGTKRGDHEPAETSNGVVSVAQNFDGSNDYITLDQASLTSGIDVYEMWLKSVQTSTPQTILSSGFKDNTAGFVEISRPPPSDASSGNDLLFDYSTNSTWVQRAATIGIDLTCIASFKGSLYGGASDGRFYAWNGVNSWTIMPALPTPEKFSSLSVFNNKLYAGTNGGGKLYEWDVGYSSWILKAPTLRIRSLILFNPGGDNKIYGGTDDGRLLVWNTNVWNVVAPQLGSENSINALTVFGGSIYAGTSPGGKLYRWDGSSSWILIASPPTSNPFTDVMSLTVFNGKIYAGTNPGGYLMSWTNGSSWVLEKTTGETSITAFYTPSPATYTQIFNYAAGGTTGSWTNPNNAIASDSVYMSHVPETIHPPSSYPSPAVWTNPQRAYVYDSNYATTSTNNAQQVFAGYGTFTSTDPISNVFIGIQGFGSNKNQAIKLSVWDVTTSTWITVTPNVALNNANPSTPIWIDVTSLTAWTLTKLNNLQTRVQFIKSGSGSVSLDYLPLEVRFGPATQTISSFSNNPSGESITKVEVGVEGYLSDPTGDEQLAVSVSSDNGSTWSSAQTITLPHPIDTHVINYFDFTSYTTWTPTLLDNNHFKIKVTDIYVGAIASSTYIDYINVRITSNHAVLYAATFPHTYVWTLTITNSWSEIINTKYSTESSITSLAYLSNTLYGCTSPSGVLVKQGTGGSANTWVLAASPPSPQKITTIIADGTTIYGGTAPNGLLYKSTGSNWSQVASVQYGQESTILSLAFDSTGTWVEAGTDLNGLLLGVLKTQNGGSWTKNADISLSTETKIPSMAIYNGKLYLSTYPHGLLYEWDGVNAWLQKAPQYPSQTGINSLTVFQSALFGGTSSGSLLKWATGDTTWTQVAPSFGSETSINALATFNSKLYAGTSPGGRLLEWNGANAWVGMTYILGAETNILSLAIYNGKLYGGTSPNGLLYEWDGATKWVKMANSQQSQTGIPALVIFNNKLYGVTQATGCLFEFSDSGSRIVPSFFTGLDNKWVYVTIVADYTHGLIDVYRNSTHITQLTSPTRINYPKNSPRYIAAYVVAGTAYNPYTGGIDELRISQTTKDQNWITLTYNNERSPGTFNAVSPEESVFFTVKAKVSSENGPVGNATVTGTLIFCDPGAVTPSYEHITSLTATTNSAGITSVRFPGYTSTIGVYCILIRANHAGIYGSSYYLSTSSLQPEPVGVLASDYSNGTLTIVHRKDLNVHYPDGDIVGYNATLAMPFGTSFYRPVSLNSAGVIGLGSPQKVQLGAAKEDPGILLVFYKTTSGTYGVTCTPWGVSAMGLEAAFGAPNMDATNIITKTRVVNIQSLTYEVKVELWKIGR